MPLVVELSVLKSELVLLAIMGTTAPRAILSLDLVREITLMTQNLVETRQEEIQIMDARVSKP